MLSETLQKLCFADIIVGVTVADTVHDNVMMKLM